MRLTERDNPYPDEPREHIRGGVHTAFNEGAKAQLKKVVEWVIELNDLDEEEDNSPGAYYVISKNLWQALLEEI